MKKIILIDGNNLMFRSYYATAYTGNVMKNSKGFPTNALYGFVGMMNKIIHEEKPEYVAVAFDIGKNFRKQKYETYKDGRSETPDELKQQMPIAREILNAMGIQYFEMEPYEADDIIGTFAKMCEEDPEYEALIVSSDKDLLQLISDETEVKLLKQKDYIRYNKKNFKEDWGFEPIRMIDYKALAGDPSDNIPGVKGIGDKTAINLLNQGLGQRLLISGVQSQTTVKDIISREDVKLISTNPIELGYTATDTVGNAKEVRDWVNKHNLKSIHVVTSFYHVPRSRLELEKELPSIEVNFISVPSEYVSSKWWSKIRSFCFVAKEYTKFLIVYIQYKMLGL